MQEARFSTNIRYTITGLEEQLTIRNDTDLAAHFAEVKKARDLLNNLGAHSAKSNGSSQNVSTDPQPTAPVCKKCGSSDDMELVSFTKDGKPKDAWKCQKCNAWHYDEKNGGKK
jgi:ribosomal protein L40E